MGNFYVNFTTRGPEQAAVANCLRSAKRKAYVGPVVEGVTVFVDQDSDTQDEAVIVGLGKQASKELSAPVLAVLNHDDEILAYWLFDAGKLVDEYNSDPGYLDGGARTPSGGDTKRLCAASEGPTKVNEVDAVLRNEEFVFALDRHLALASLLNHPWSSVCMGYRYIDEGLSAEGVSGENFIRIG